MATVTGVMNDRTELHTSGSSSDPSPWCSQGPRSRMTPRTALGGEETTRYTDGRSSLVRAPDFTLHVSVLSAQLWIVPSSVNTGAVSRYCRTLRSFSNGHSTFFHVMKSLTCLASSQNFCLHPTNTTIT